MDATILLADAANATPDGRVNALGLGWTRTVSPTPPAALVLVIAIDWTETNRQIPMSIELVDADGQPFFQPDGLTPVKIEAQLEAGRPPGMKPGSTQQQTMHLGIGPGIPLNHGQSYEWRLTIDGEHKEHWSARFEVR